MNFTVENIEYFLLILVRISAFAFSAPFFNQTNAPRKLKMFVSFFMSVIVFQVLDLRELAYVGVIGYAALVIKEAIVGVMIGLMANICTYILEFSGRLIDMEIGFAMVTTLNPATNMETSITGTLYSNVVMLMLIVTDMHHYIINACIASFTQVPLGEAVFESDLYLVMTHFISDYFVIAFRIILPVFCCILIVNVVLGILAKVASQMNMFVIGMQLKVMMGLAIMFMIAGLLPYVSSFIFDEMKTMMSTFIEAVRP